MGQTKINYVIGFVYIYGTYRFNSFVYQNLITLYPSIIKTRRYKMFIKLHSLPHIWFKIQMLTLKNTQRTNFIGLLSIFYLRYSIWFFYQNIFFKNIGLLTNNLHKSYEY